MPTSPIVQLAGDEVLPEALQLAAMRDVLKTASRRVSVAGRRNRGPVDAVDLGRLAEALDAAEAAVFNALNTASAFCESKAADAALRAAGIEV